VSNGETDQYVDDMELATASATERYKSYLIDSFIELTEMSERVMMNMLHGRGDWDATNAYISRMIHLSMHIYPKVAGSPPSKIGDLKDRFVEFKPWFENPTIPIANSEEGNKIPQLFMLIREAFERLGLTPF
jgi:hypothetical protein